MDGNPTIENINLDTEIKTIDEILIEKRKEIDQDIAEFTMQKNNEYIMFEKKLRAQRGKSTAEDNLQGSLSMRHGNEDKAAGQHYKGMGVPVEVNEALLMKRKGAGAQSPNSYSSATKISQHAQYTGHVEGFTLGSPSNSGTPRGTPVHEREVEFRGLFTPSYLPLLDSSAHGFAISPLKPQNIIGRSEEEPSSLRDLPSPKPSTAISSSASPETAHEFLVNTPQRESSLRRSSSRSDTSIASLRSSLRGPKHPRSSKRVLFSIDNVVVSPSTAPIKRRTNIIPRVQSSELDNIPQGFENIATGTAKHSGEGPNASNSRRRSSSPPGEITTLYKSRPFRRSSNLKGAVPFIAGDDFETVDYEDDLFTFDEDIGIGELEHADKSSGHFGSDEEDDDKNDIDMSSSPHAGSLPIEIKWPVRQDPRKSC